MGFGRDGRGAIINESRTQALGTLAANAGIFLATKLPITDDFRMLKNEALSTIVGLTAGEGIGLEIWMVDGDLTLAEAEEKIETEGPVSRHAKIENERVFRFVKPLGYAREAVNSEIDMVDVHTGAKLLVSKPRWTWGKTTSWQYMMFNRGFVLTTGANWRLQATSFGVWLD